MTIHSMKKMTKSFVFGKIQIILTLPSNWGFYWGDARFNRGRSYVGYRFGPILIRKFI